MRLKLLLVWVLFAAICAAPSNEIAAATGSLSARKLSARVVSGFRLPVDRIPVMAGSTTSGVTITATSETTPAWRVGDNDNTTYWQRNAGSGVLLVDFGASGAFVAVRYKVGARDTASGLEPKSWTFEGSPDNSAWTTLDTQTNITSWANAEVKSYPLANVTSYRYYRINVSAGNGASFLQIAEVEILG